MRVLCILAALTIGATILAIRHGSALMDAVLPPDTSRIAGIALGELGDSTRIPRRALDCTSPEPLGAYESCTLTLDGQVLAVQIEYPPPRHIQFAACQASYGPTTTGCWAVIYAVTGPLIYAHIPAVRPGQSHDSTQWLGPSQVQRVQTPHLELTQETLDAIRRQYPLDNYFERDWVAVFRTTTAVAALSVALLAFLLTSTQRPLRQPGLPALTAPLTGLVAAASCGGTVFGVSYVALLFGAMRAGLVD